MKITRSHSLKLIGAALVLPSCGGKSGGAPGAAVRVGSKNFGEDITIAEIYAAALERAKIPVERHVNLGSTQIAMAAMQRGDIDLYPEYTGTALIDVLHLPPMRDAKALYDRVRAEYRERFGMAWLARSPVNDSQGLCTTQSVARRYGIRTLSDCAKAAPRLRLAAVPEFVARADSLPGLQKFYGGFTFKDVKTYDIGLQYTALQQGSADVATAFTTDAQIIADDLVVLRDDKGFWPPYNVAPIVREKTLRAHPRIADVLDKIAPLLTDDAVRKLNMQVNVQHQDPADAAQAFLKEHGI
ncbi:MAG TPA: glycine betaine ABC transporter substrate-binding protein [Candidatus Baltobacteraceae bacterium]|nr:glycine betaine ABC transporter substrate-binding protein [Candidatus Baltobacteraceae bacterium]